MFKRIKDFFDLKPPSMSVTNKSWSDWEKECKKNKPFVYWLKEELPYFYSDFIQEPLKNIHRSIEYRITERYHVINTKLKPGYYDTDTRLMHGMFSLLVDFIECEKAHMYMITTSHSSKRHKRFWNYLNPFKTHRYKRVPEAGLAHLSWEMSLFNNGYYNSQQASSAKDQYDLYIWWTKTRPARADPYEKYEMGKWYEQNGLGFHNEHSEEQKKQKKELYAACDQLEKEYNDEDTEMMIKLIKIRDSLWT